MSERKALVAIIGRQNVGKSTLLNRLAGKRIAIVEDLPGTTRDRVFADVTWQDKTFTVVDTGGLGIDADNEIGRGVTQQVEVAVRDADLIIFLTDAKDGVMPTDVEIANMVRRTAKPVLLVVNKVDNDSLENQVPEFYKLGLGEPFAISAYHALNTGELLDKIIEVLPIIAPVPDDPAVTKVAIVGRPNVGKSLLLNSLLGEERAIVSDVPGTTRDATDTRLEFGGEKFILIDTAGIRRRGSVEVGVEKYSVLRSMLAIDRCDVALLVMDATEPAAAQDLHVGGYIHQANKGIVIIVNKWDLIAEKKPEEWIEALRHNFKFVSYAPILFISAKTKKGVEKVMPMALQVYQERMKQIPDTVLRDIIQQAVSSHNIPRKGKYTLSIKNVKQTGVNPPTFTFRVNDARLIHFSYQRYLENQIRDVFGFMGTPIRLIFSTGGQI
ncbi:MAG: ribosome biogenesis GTPase Der [Dehalococcoidales bacterium]|nr:ribosome biogenesis GTPase Der [Dehalococcoidales bacterium]